MKTRVFLPCACILLFFGLTSSAWAYLDEDFILQPKSVQKTEQSRKYTLRSTPMDVSGDRYKEEFGLDDNGKPKQDIPNDYKDNGDGTVTDRATGLMWQQSGSDKSLIYNKAVSYIQVLNMSRFAGYSDWRLPTIPELMSLLESSKKNNNLYIDPVFDSEKEWCWSSDRADSGSAWDVNFISGKVYWYYHFNVSYVRAVRSGQ